MSRPTEEHTAKDRSIEDFGAQWQRYTENEGYYASMELLRDICEPLLPLTSVEGARVLEIGSGTGRIVNMLVEAGAQSVVAVEPSAACSVLRSNTQRHGERVQIVEAAGDAIPPMQVDLALSIGVLHHIPEPEPVVQRAFEVLRPGGRFLIWLYGYEGNRLYLSLVQPLRAVTTWLPDRLLAGMSHVLNGILTPYMWLCSLAPLPLAGYLKRVLSRFGWRQRSLVIFDQLNPSYARYYRGEEASALLEAAGFTDVQRHHRHGYSWSVVGTKPQSPD